MSFNDDIGSLPEEQTILDAQSNVGGGMMMTWGTGFQKGMKLGPESPRLANADQLTVATSAVEYQNSIISNASTGFYSRECKRLEAEVQEQREARARLEEQLNQYREVQEKGQEMINMQLSNNNAAKLMLTDQRNMLPTGENYMRHP